MDSKIQEIYKLFKDTLPFIIRAESTAKNIIGHPQNIILEKRDENNRLIACAVVNENTILLLCVETAFQNRGIGSELLQSCEKIIFENGYDSVVLGAGFDYLMPGVPTSKRYAVSIHEKLLPELNSNASNFFEKRGYHHSWGKCNCFDMCMPLNNAVSISEKIGDEINGILYKWATLEDVEEITKCVDDACKFGDESFSPYYQNKELYKADSNKRVLVALKNGKIVGALIVCMGVEKDEVGSVGCTSVCSAETHQGIATTMIKLGTKYLKSKGLKYGFLGYTYSGLDKMYGESGYEISVYYFMGEKQRTNCTRGK